MSGAPQAPPGEVPTRHGPDAIAVTVLVAGLVFLFAGAITTGSGAYILAAQLHSPQGAPIFWAGIAGLGTGLGLALISRLR